MALATKTCPQARLGAPLYETDHRPMTVIGFRKTGTLPIVATNTIDFCKVPKGARIIDCGVIASKAATMTDFDLGLFDTYDQSTYEANAVGLMEAGDLNTQLIETASSAASANTVQLGKKLTWDCYVRLLDNTGNLGNDVDVLVWVTYVMAVADA